MENHNSISALLLIQLIVLGLFIVIDQLLGVLGATGLLQTVSSLVLFTVFVIVTFVFFVQLMLRKSWNASFVFLFGVFILYAAYAIGIYMVKDIGSGLTVGMMLLTVVGLVLVPRPHKRVVVEHEHNDAKPKNEDEVLVASTHGNKVHRPSCTVVSRVPKEDRIPFDSFNDAVKQGYIGCKLCAPDKK
jgi:hypothetical protein